MSANSNNLYKVLDLDSSCTTDDVKKAFIRLSKLYHPDRHDNSRESNEKFKLITQAYATLSNPGKRRRYDSSVNRNFYCNDIYRTAHGYYEPFRYDEGIYTHQHSTNTNHRGVKPFDRHLRLRSKLLSAVFLIIFISSGLNMALFCSMSRSQREQYRHQSSVLNRMFEYSKEQARINGVDLQLEKLTNHEMNVPTFKEMEELMEKENDEEKGH